LHLICYAAVSFFFSSHGYYSVFYELLCNITRHVILHALPYLRGGKVVKTCPALRLYQFGPMRNPDVTRRSQWSAMKPKHRLWSRTNFILFIYHQPPGTG